ncbi:hypothetical protein [Nocardia jinanensis]|uniref:Uncharacterized protein n=1 Tax=Nocardia jinanensis TaxID=382504 RepID=A0A917RB42_9NOCA|nr:hypothetical protein [Nocardia jinanensis]GGK98524.1 hypothetical protein GCM10011588_11380 [Nocardia jinanensis]
MHPRRLLAIGVTVAALLVANSYAGFALYAFTAGPRVEAEVLGCTGQKFPRCQGRWTLPDGTRQSGAVAQANRSDVGELIGVRVAPVVGAYKERMAGLWIRLLWAIVVDSALLAACATIAVVMVRSRRRARVLRAAVSPEQHLWIRRGRDIRDSSGRKMWSGRRSRRRMVALTGSGGTQFRIRTGYGVLYLDNDAGEVSGRVEADRGAGRTISYTIYDAADAPGAFIAVTSVQDSAWEVTDTRGVRFGELVVAVGDHSLLLQRTAPAALEPLLAAFLLDIDRMLLEATPRRLTVGEPHRRRTRVVAQPSPANSSGRCKDGR